METLKTSTRKFCEKSTTYLLESDAPAEITRHGNTIGYFTAASHKRSETERAALKEASARWREILDTEGVSEEATVADFKRWRAKQKR